MTDVATPEVVDTEAARQVTWPEVVEARRQAACQPAPEPVADTPAPSTPVQIGFSQAQVDAMVAAAEDRAQAKVDAMVATALERAAAVQGGQIPPAAAPGAPGPVQGPVGG